MIIEISSKVFGVRTIHPIAPQGERNIMLQRFCQNSAVHLNRHLNAIDGDAGAIKLAYIQLSQLLAIILIFKMRCTQRACHIC